MKDDLLHWEDVPTLAIVAAILSGETRDAAEALAQAEDWIVMARELVRNRRGE